MIGDNGCGKSTLLQLLSGALPIHSGTVTLSHQCLMARIEQHLPPELHASTLLDAVLAQLPAGQHLSERWRCEALLTELGFEPVSWTLTAGTLSGGQHTRLLLARALIRQPDLLLLDEPSNHRSAHATVVGAVLAQLERQLRAGIARSLSARSGDQLHGSCATKRCSSSVCPAPLRASHWRNRTLRTSIGAAEQKEIDRVEKAPNARRSGAKSMTTKIWRAKPSKWKSASIG